MGNFTLSLLESDLSTWVLNTLERSNWITLTKPTVTYLDNSLVVIMLAQTPINTLCLDNTREATSHT